MKQKKNLPVELADLDRQIKKSMTVIIGLILILPFLYSGWFWYNGAILSISSGDWGTLGDFLGGTLNPIIAFSAFYWLTKSVRFQREELAETRSALQESSEAQAKQVRLAALTALTSSIMTEVETQRSQITFFCEQFRDGEPAGVFNLEGDWINSGQTRELIASINKHITNRLSERYEYEKEIKAMLG